MFRHEFFFTALPYQTASNVHCRVSRSIYNMYVQLKVDLKSLLLFTIFFQHSAIAIGYIIFHLLNKHERE